MSRPWQEAVTELVSTGLTQQQLALLLEVVTGVTRDVTSNVTRDGSSRSSGAIRAARYRENIKIKKALAKANDVAEALSAKRDASRDGVTVCCDLSSSTESILGKEGNREEELLLPVLVEGQVAPKRSTRGTRMSPDAQISPDDFDFALNEGMTPERVRQAWAEFVDYWIGVPGQRGTKLNWSSTWRNRVRELMGTGGKANGHRGPRAFQNGRQHPADLALDLAEQARELERKAGISR